MSNLNNLVQELEVAIFDAEAGRFDDVSLAVVKRVRKQLVELSKDYNKLHSVSPMLNIDSRANQKSLYSLIQKDL